MSLTRYGLGKYNLNADAWLHSLETDDETGDCETTGWYGLYRTEVCGSIGFTVDAKDKTEFVLSAEDIEFIESRIGAIAYEDSQGFVTVEWFASTVELDKAWSAIEDDIAVIEDDIGAAAEDIE